MDPRPCTKQAARRLLLGLGITVMLLNRAALVVYIICMIITTLSTLVLAAATLNAARDPSHPMRVALAARFPRVEAYLPYDALGATLGLAAVLSFGLGIAYTDQGD